MIGCSAALTFRVFRSSAPSPAARVGYIDGEYILNPTLDRWRRSSLDLAVAGTERAC